jgi:vanillate O-demethylase monooxygenase subunit
VQIQDKISTTRRFAFEEQDAPVIEAQQEIIDDAFTPVDPVILAIDVGPVRYKQVLQKLIRAEQAH